MVLVDIYVPILGKIYDFQLNEHIPIGSVVDEIAEMIEQKEHIVDDAGSRGFDQLQLWNRKTKMVCPKTKTLYECQIGNADSLILV